MSEPKAQWRQELVNRYGEDAVRLVEGPPPEPDQCLDTMDGRHWCRTHDASWPFLSGPRCAGGLEQDAAKLRGEG